MVSKSFLLLHMLFEILEKSDGQQLRLMPTTCVVEDQISSARLVFCRGESASFSSELLPRYSIQPLSAFPTSLRVVAFGNVLENLAKLETSNGGDYDHLGSRG
jgi:hypothetical protein